jgi:hypothetical protein
MCPSLRPPRAKRLRFAVALAASAVAAGLGAAVGCGSDVTYIWTCLNPATGREDPSIHDVNHFVNGMYDPCHCFDPCGETATCPILVDAGPQPTGCDAGSTGDGGH